MKHIVAFYGVDVNYLPQNEPIWRGRYRELFLSVDRVLCEGPHMARCISQLGCPEDKISIRHLGIQVEKIAFRPRICDSSRPLAVLIAGTFREKKGIPYALEALARFRSEVPGTEYLVMPFGTAA